MNRLAVLIARQIWWSLLWLIRRPAMKKTQRIFLSLVPEGAKLAAHRSQIRQNALARRIGLPWLTAVVMFSLITVAFTSTYEAALYLVESGALHGPSKTVTFAMNDAE